MKTPVSILLPCALALTVALAACGILTAPASLPAAVARNANFSFHGLTVDQDGKELDGVVVTRHNDHHFWTPIKGGAEVNDTIIRRADGSFKFDDRGEALDFVFRKDGYLDAVFRMNSDNPDLVITSLGNWRNTPRFPAVLFSTATPDAALAHYNDVISYAEYPVADVIALPNLATEGRSGDIVYHGKNAEDPTVFPPGTLYLLLGREPPPAINSRGDINPADLDIPHHVTLRLAGPGSGLMHIEPRIGYHPIAVADQAPAQGYTHEITLDRARLKEMRQARQDDIIAAHEFFFFRAGNRYGKGTFSWGSTGGQPTFRFDLFIQPQPDNRVLTTHKMAG